MKYLKNALIGVAIGVSAWACAALAGDLPPSIADAPAIARKCAPLAGLHAARWDAGRVAKTWRLKYLWKSAPNDALEVDPMRPPEAEHYCARLQLFGGDGAIVDAATFLCTVTDRATPGEVWMFGNYEIAERICRADAKALEAMDRAPALIDQQLERR